MDIQTGSPRVIPDPPSMSLFLEANQLYIRSVAVESVQETQSTRSCADDCDAGARHDYRWLI